MNLNHHLYQVIRSNPKINNFWGQEFLRDVLIPDLLGNDTHSILYWAGKRMANRYPLSSSQDLITFFAQTGLGKLDLISQSKTKINWQLGGQLVKKRLAINPKCDFMFEAGFLAKNAEQNHHLNAEAEINPKKIKRGQILIQIISNPNHKLPVQNHREWLRIISNDKKRPS